MAQQVLIPPPTVRRRTRGVLAAVVVAVVLLGVAVAAAVWLVARRASERATASATLVLADGRSVGRVDFFDADGATLIRARVNLPAGLAGTAAFHGFHVHANDDATNGNGCLAQPDQPSKSWFASADAHLDHGRHQHPQHGGDMPSIYVTADGRGDLEFRTDRMAAADLTGRVVMLHAGPDNFGRVPVGGTAQDYSANSPQAAAATQAGGNSGDRIACGVIGAPSDG
jgi:Cu-Zn family superoxide dismutase